MNKKATLNLQENRDIGQVLNATFVFIGITFKKMLRDVMLIAGPFYILSGIFASLTAFNSLRMLGSFGNSGIFSQFQFYSPAYWMAKLCLLIGWSLSYTVVCNHVLQYNLNGVDYSVQEVRVNIRKDFMRVMWGCFLNVLVVIAATILFVIPGIYLLVANSLLTTILVLDKNTDTIDAFGESRRLIRDNWWAALGLGIIVSIITYAVQFVFSIPSVIVTGIITFNTIRHGDVVTSYQPLLMALSALAYIGMAAVSMVSVTASSVYYYSLKEKKDHTSLLQNIESIGVQPAKAETDIQKDEGDF